jgi:glycosyltransferase involved in cell wall biosynthesis
VSLPDAPLIAVDLTPLRPGGEGGGNKVVALTALSGLLAAGDRWRYLALTTDENDAEVAQRFGGTLPRLRVRRAPGGEAESAPRHAAGLLSSRGVDLLFCPFTPPIYAEPSLGLVSVVYDLQSFEYPQFFPAREVVDRQAHLERLSWLADRIICVSDYTRRCLAARFPAAAARCVVVGSDVHRRLRVPTPAAVEEARARLGLAGRGYLFYPANFWPHKNHRMLLLAYRLLRDRLAADAAPDLVFTGARGPLEADLRRAVEQMGLGRCVRFLGLLDEDDLAAVYRGARAVVFPSLHEGFGMPVVEAMHLGRPVAGSDAASLPEVAGGAALLFDPRRPGDIAEAVGRLLAEPATVDDLVARGRARAAQLALRDMARGYRDVLAEVLGGEKRYVDAVSGVWADGWMEPRVSLTHGAGAAGRVWEVRLTPPASLPAAALEVSVHGEDQAPRAVRVARERPGTLRVPLSTAPGRVVLELSPAHQPGRAGGGTDDRWLAALCESCRVLSPDGTTRALVGSREAPRLEPGDLGRAYLNGYRSLDQDDADRAPAVSGLDGDGWAGEFVVVSHGEGPPGRVCEVRFEAAWQRSEDLRIAWWGAAEAGGCRLAPGESVALAVALAERRGHLVFRLWPTVFPLSAEDAREVAGLCHECVIRGDGGAPFALHPPPPPPGAAADVPGHPPQVGSAGAAGHGPAAGSPPRERVLVVDYRVPHHDRGGGDPRMAAILRALATGWPQLRLTLAAVSDAGAARYAPALRALGIEVACGLGDWTAWFERRRHFFGTVVTSRVHDLDEAVRRTQPRAWRIFDVEALFFRRAERRAAALEDAEERAAARAQAARLRATEAAAAAAADALWCVTEEERAVAATLAPGKPSCLVAHGVARQAAPPPWEARRDLVFLGGFLAGPGSPNEDAVLHLVGEVMPRLWERDPSLRLRVVGADPTPAVRALHVGRVEVVGFVDDPRPHLGRARVLVAPERFGAGLKLKLVESMAAGLPFVTTEVGAEGLGLGPLAPLAVGEDAEGVAARAWRLYTEREAWEGAQAGLLALAALRFSPEALRAALGEALAAAGILAPGADAFP